MHSARPAAALAWPAPASRDVNPDEMEAILARGDRGEFAVLGFDLPTIQTLDVIVYDRQDRQRFGHGFGTWSDEYDRRAVSTRTFVRQR